MAKEKDTKTNVMRILDKNKISYEAFAYEVDEFVDGIHCADAIGAPHEQSFKTLVAQGKSKDYFVFVVPIEKEIYLKSAARAVGEKSVEMIHVKELLGLTGYVRGGCSPIGMKKKYPTFIDETCILYDEIYVSAGARGVQIIIEPNDLAKYTEALMCDLVKG